jgi:hypothetical protein
MNKMHAMHSIPLRDHWTQTEEPSGVVFVRNFGAPRLPDAANTVWLIGQCNQPFELVMNDHTHNVVPIDGRFELNITACLQPRNRVRCCGDAGFEIGHVALEIRDF